VKATAPGCQGRVNVVPPGSTAAQSRGRPAPGTAGAARRVKGTGVADLLYAVVVIAVFAVLLLAVRGLDRL
jgi:hypothetical protein